MDAFVYIDHKGVKVDATFAHDGRGKGVEEEVHEHGLAGTDISVKVEALGRIRWSRIWFWWSAGEEAGEERGGGSREGRNGWRRVGEELFVEGVEMLDDATLVGIRTEHARGDERVVLLQRRTSCGGTSSGGEGSSCRRRRQRRLPRDANTNGLSLECT